MYLSINSVERAESRKRKCPCLNFTTPFLLLKEKLYQKKKKVKKCPRRDLNPGLRIESPESLAELDDKGIFDTQPY